MAKKPASSTSAKSSTASAKAGARRDLEIHNEWLNYLKPVSIGLVFSPNALRQAQFIPDTKSTQAQKALEPFTAPLPIGDDAPLAHHDNPPRTFTSVWSLLTGFLGWNPDLIDTFSPDELARMIPASQGKHFLLSQSNTRPDQLFNPVPANLKVVLEAYGHDTLEPHFAYRWPEGRAPESSRSTYAILGLVVPHDVELDRKPQDDFNATWWVDAPQKKFERLLNDTGVPIGLIIHGKSLRVVYKPQNQTSGYITFPIDALLKSSGRLSCTALKELLNHQRIHTLSSKQRLHSILEQSRKFQNEVSTELADQVLAALFELLKGFQIADEQSRNTLLAGLRDNPDQTHVIYDALLTVLMRLVFLLYAEERDMFPADALFSNNYSISGLFARLVEDESQNPDTMDLRYGAWAHLVALFRVMHDGVDYQTLPDNPSTRHKILPRNGYLFDPERFLFLEGRNTPGHESLVESAHQPTLTEKLPLVSDGVVLRVLRNLLYLKNERLSYRSLEVEQIGSVYEAIMGFTVETTTGRSVAIKPEKRGGAPTILNLDSILETKPEKRSELIKEATDRKLPAKASAEVKAARSLEELQNALDHQIDKRLTAAPVPAGSLLFQPSPERRRSGSHYTPRALTEPIVKKALEPILNRLGHTPTSEQILALKVCDPAMGSGAFLVEAMRQLADLLLNAWKVHGNQPQIPADETPFLFACRLIAQRCLYGVDKNPMAVSLAKLSLWLATLARDHAFTFLDHNLRHGDSLVGLSLANLEACHWASTIEQSFVGPAMRNRIRIAMSRRTEILSAKETTSYQRLTDLRTEADKPLDFVRFLANAVVGVFFEGGKDKAMESRRRDLALTIKDFLSPQINMADQIALRPDIEKHARTLEICQPHVSPFHWEMEFPEVFLMTNADGSIERSPAGGFDMIVGNPPFAGKNTLAEANAKGYPDWLKVVHPESHGNADLVAHFFRRSFGLIRPGGSFGLIATNTIAQGDTRSTGLRWICHHGGVIYGARKRLKWPGLAAVVVSTIHIAKPALLADSNIPTPELENRPVERITAFLFPKGGHDDPARLHANAGKSFQGSIVLGMGFTFDDTESKGKASPISRARADELAKSGQRPISMEELLAKEPRNQERIFPYIGGKEVNTSPTHAYHRYVIDFFDRSLEEASQWPDLIEIVREKVRPERDVQNRDALREKWWQYAEKRPGLINAIRGLERVLVTNAQAAPHSTFCFMPNGSVFANSLNVFPFESINAFCLLQSRIHEIVAWYFSSSMKDDLRYNPTDCFETFPFPENWEKTKSLESAGKTYYEYRAALMVETNKGLTETYNDFHDPKCATPAIEKLRSLHACMDTAVLAAYGWPDIDTTCGFDLDYCDAEPADDASPETLDRLERGDYWFATANEAKEFSFELGDGANRLPWRYRWRPEVRDDILARLLLLNKDRAEAERQAGLSPLAATHDDLEDDDWDE